MASTSPLPRFANRLAIAAAACFGVLASTATFAAYPDRPITLIVPFAPGGANDVVARVVQQPLADALGQPIIIENRGGAGGSVGTGYAARQKPDGYTLLLAASGFVVNPSLYNKVPYDPYKDFDAVAEFAKFPIIFAVRPDSGMKTLADLTARARREPGKLNYSSPGGGTLAHLGAELLKLHAGIDIVHIPFPSAAPAAQAVIGGHVDVAAASVAVAKPQIDAGLLTGLAVTGTERWIELPNVPTVIEVGVPQAVVETWQGLMVPAGTPKDIIDRLSKAMLDVVKQAGVRDRMLKPGFHWSAAGPDEFHKRVIDELPKWKDLIERARIPAQ
jgi:tripartite-type tricarboxylate transporter receptor subunit TctC